MLTRYLIGRETAAMLGLRQAPYRDRVQFWCMLRVWRGSSPIAGLFHEDRPYRFASEWLHKRLMDRMGNLARPRAVQIPSEFIERWFPEVAGGSPPVTI